MSKAQFGQLCSVLLHCILALCTTSGKVRHKKASKACVPCVSLKITISVCFHFSSSPTTAELKGTCSGPSVREKKCNIDKPTAFLQSVYLTVQMTSVATSPSGRYYSLQIICFKPLKVILLIGAHIHPS